jgi:hypothetical protein
MLMKSWLVWVLGVDGEAGSSMYSNSQDVCAGKRFPHKGIQVRKRATSRRPSFSFSLQYYGAGVELYAAAKV